jgi:tetratricopeptide (TPR) repeat protein
MSKRSPHLTGLLAGVLASATALTAIPTTAIAAVSPSDSDLEEAKKLYERAKGRFDAGEFPEAAGLFVSAYELSGEPNLLYNASYAFERADDYENALKYLRKYRDLAPPEERGNLDEEIAQLESRKEAAESGDDLEPDKIGDPEPEPEKEPARKDPMTDDEPRRIFGPAAAVLTATTIIGAGMGIGFGVAALNRRNAAEDACVSGGPDGVLCESSAQDDEDKRRTYAILADTGIAVGVVSAIALTTVLLVNRKRARSKTALRVAPNVSGSTASVWVSGRF